MDLLQTLHLIRNGEIRPAYSYNDLERLGFTSSQTSMAFPSSSQLVPSQDLASSQGLGLSQGRPDGYEDPATIERPFSCGQPEGDENCTPDFRQQSSLSFRTLSHHNDTQKMQSEDQDPGYMQELRSCGNIHGAHNNVEEITDDLSDMSNSPQMMPMVEWEKANPFEPNTKLVPATVPRSTGEWTTKFQHRCDQHGFRPEFADKEVPDQRFLVTLKVCGRTFVNEEPQPSKKLAKEAACKLALSEMQPDEKMEGVEGASKKGKKRKSADAGLEQPDVSKVDRSQDWVGMLNSHCQRSKCAPPKYEDTRIEGAYQRSLSKVTIFERPDEPFAPDVKPFATKKEAQAAVAREAVFWLQSKGLLSEAVEKRRRSEESSLDCALTDLTNTSRVPREKSLPEQVHELGITLGLKVQPRWVLKPSTLRSGQPLESSSPFYDCHAEFDERDTMIEERLRGRVGQIKHCLGQKKAKEACCERVVPILEGIKKRRLAAI